MMTTAYPFSVSGDEFKGKRFWSQAAPKEWKKLLSAASHRVVRWSQRRHAPHHSMDKAHRYSCKPHRHRRRLLLGSVITPGFT